MKLVQGMHASLLLVSTDIRLVQGMTTLWALICRALDRLLAAQQQHALLAHCCQGAFTHPPDHYHADICICTGHAAQKAGKKAPVPAPNDHVLQRQG